MRIEKRRGDKLVAVEEHEPSARGYFRDELLMMLGRAGFSGIQVTGDYSADRRTPTALSWSSLHGARRAAVPTDRRRADRRGMRDQ